MAGEETTNQGNIKPEYNVARSGLNLDQSVNQVPKGKLTYALNAAVENFDANSVNYQNEPGNELCFDFPSGYQLIGEHFIQEKNKHIFFLANPETGGSEIGYMDNNDCIYHTLVNAPCLNFSVKHPIPKAAHKITNCTTEIYWTDGVNPRRYLDLDNIPYKLAEQSTLCDPIYSQELDCNQLSVQPNFTIPELSIVDVVTGGDLKAGTYQFAIQYSDAAGNPYTSYYSVTNPTPIANPQLTTPNFDYTVGKSIVVSVSNLDVTGQFQYFNLAVIKTINAIASVELIGTYFITAAQRQITYTGQNVTNIRLTTSDIFEKYPYYEIAQDLTAVQDVLVWDNLTSIDRINYQQIANNITLQWQTYRIPANENYADELNATNLRGYLRDEVYAFEIVFLLKNGKQTDGFHIPGRVKGGNEFSHPDVPDTNPDFIGTPDYITGVTGYSAYWKIYNTASVTGNSPEYSPSTDYKGPYQYGEFAYWESEERYPCNVDVWGDLADQPIRHHKMPDVRVSPIFETPAFVYNPDGTYAVTMQKDAIFPLGVRIDVQQITQLIASSSLTSEQKANIAGFKIVRGDRSTNSSIVAKGILRNVGKYKREETEYYFPNYPYNDLREDPFLLTNNNAFETECKAYLIVPTADGEVRFRNCLTNEEDTQNVTNGVSVEICSIGKPTFNTGTGTVSLARYDVWEVCQPFGGGRWAYTDPGIGYTTIWVPWFGCSTINSTTTPVKISGDQRGTRTIVAQYFPSIDCGETLTNLDGFNNDESLYRYVFNSPETSFGQPFLGNVLKLENAIFGAGSAHFVQVKKNALYKLLTKEAQQDALASSSGIGSIGSGAFDAVAMFTAYQAYLQIYINGITRRNYAYSFNSIANYDYGASIDNNLGIKQRELDIYQYLIPGVQSVGDPNNISINNFQRESSVYLKTKESKPALPFVSKTPSLLSGTTSLIEDASRFTISERGLCNNPAKESPITVASYYGSLKNVFVNQWGQIYSYQTIDTGFQRNIELINNSQPSFATIFGGDTFISRFAFKTKLPFFFDNRVGAPDDSDIFYDEIGNVAYPKYWHSARSILSDYLVVDGVNSQNLTNIISIKAHNFDCPNSQEPATNNPNRTYYDGKFYLFAYGVPNFYCESSINVDLRQAFNNREGDFWPHVNTSIPDDWVQESYVSIAFDNTYHYNATYSKQNKENFFSHLPPDWKQQLCYTNYPFRAIYSDTANDNPDVRVNNWLSYGATAMFDFPQNYGDLISLDGIQNKAILARFENKSLLYNTLLTVQTSNPQAAYLGNDTLFKSAPPIDFAETDLGYVGSQNKFLLKIPQGQITVDAKRGQVFLISGNQAVDLSAFGSGLNRFFTDHLAFEILRYFPDADTDNHFNGLGLHGVYDSKYDRVIITKLDYIPINKNVKYDADTKEFYIDVIVNQEPIRTIVYLTDREYFCNKSWTLSYNVNTNSWISFHSYIPNWYIAENNFFYSGLNDCCSEIEAIVAEIVGTTTTTTTIPTTTTTTTIFPCICYTVSNTNGPETPARMFTYTNCIGQTGIPGYVAPGNSTTFCALEDSIEGIGITITEEGGCSPNCTTTTTTTEAPFDCTLEGEAIGTYCELEGVAEEISCNCYLLDSPGGKDWSDTVYVDCSGLTHGVGENNTIVACVSHIMVLGSGTATPLGTSCTVDGDCSGSFISSWFTENPEETIYLPIYNGGTYNFTVNWGDGSPIETITSYTTNSHTYAAPEVYIITITGQIEGWSFDYVGGTSANNILQIYQWGSLVFTPSYSLLGYNFSGCTNLTLGNVVDTPSTLNVSFNGLFAGCSSLTTINNVNFWDVYNITDMYQMFADTSFNGDITGWDVSNVTNMGSMFYNASSFNQNLSGWCVTNISSLPLDFATGASSWTGLPGTAPQWGTCPP